MAAGPARHALSVLAVLGVATLASVATRAQEPPHSAELDAAIVRAAKRHGVPEHLVRRIVMRESRYNARARNHSFWGLMQISYPTARSMGFRGTPEELLNPVTNLTYAVPYLANAFVAAGRREDAAVRLYASGYYATAKNRGVLGLLRTATSAPLNGIRDEPSAQPTAVADGGGWSLFGSSAPAVEPAPAPAAAPQQLAYAAAPDVTAAAAPAQAQIQAAVAPAAPRGRSAGRGTDKTGGDGVDMVAGRDGALLPPKRWQRDGGTTVIARGEQGIEHTAAAASGDHAPASHGRRTRKIADFAQLEPAVAPGVSPVANDAQPATFYATAPAEAAAPDPAGGAAVTQTASTETGGASAATDAGAAAVASDDAPHHRHRRHRKISR